MYTLQAKLDKKEIDLTFHDEQPDMFGYIPPRTLEVKEVVKTVYDDQHLLIRCIQQLHAKNGFELDPTYSKGEFYRKQGVPEPQFKYDLFPQTEDTVQANANELPLPDLSIKTMMFDPPFIAGFSKSKPTGIIGERFHGFKNIQELWTWYDQCLAEFYRILKPKGILVFKCQDTVSVNKHWFSHCHIMNLAVNKGFYPKDMFVLTAKSRPLGHNHTKQQHARKFHSYFWVFEKKKNRVPYALPYDLNHDTHNHNNPCK